MRRSKVNIRDVAKAAGVSSGTVSLVINNNQAASEKARERVMAAVRELNYQPDPLFRTAFRKRSPGSPHRVATKTIGFFTGAHVSEGISCDDGYYSLVQVGIQQAIETHRYHLMCKSSTPNALALPNMVTEHRVDGLLVEGHFPKSLLELLVKQLPICLIDRLLPDMEVSAVSKNVEGGIHDVLNYLWDLGHREIIPFIPVPRESWSGPEMYQRGYRHFCQTRDIAVPALATPEELRPEIHEKVMEEFARKVMATRPRPTALVSGSLYAHDLMVALQRLGLRVPEDISIVGLDDTLRARTAIPAMTTYRFRMDDMGRMATDQLIRRIESPEHPLCQILVNGQIMERASCGPPPA